SPRADTVELTPDQEALRARVRALAEEELAPYAAGWDEREEFPERTIGVFREHGLLGLAAPQEHGGSGLGVFEACLAIEEVARVCLSSARVLQMSTNGPPRAIATLGTDEQRGRYLPRVVAGEEYFAIAISEPQAGSDALALTTTLRETPDGLRLTGE